MRGETLLITIDMLCIYYYFCVLCIFWHMCGAIILLIRPLPEGGLLSFVLVLVILVVLLVLVLQHIYWLHGRGHNFCLQKSRMPLAGLVYFVFTDSFLEYHCQQF